LTALALVLVGAIGITIVAARQFPFSDGRINQIAFFGGDALYCVDAQRLVTDNYDTMIDGGGFRLLNKDGQELWFISATDVTKAMQATGDGMPVLIGNGKGGYGQTALYVNTAADGGRFFLYSGYRRAWQAEQFHVWLVPADWRRGFWGVIRLQPCAGGARRWSQRKSGSPARRLPGDALYLLSAIGEAANGAHSATIHRSSRSWQHSSAAVRLVSDSGGQGDTGR